MCIKRDNSITSFVNQRGEIVKGLVIGNVEIVHALHTLCARFIVRTTSPLH